MSKYTITDFKDLQDCCKYLVPFISWDVNLGDTLIFHCQHSSNTEGCCYGDCNPVDCPIISGISYD